MPSDVQIKDPETRLNGLENVAKAARDLADRLRSATISVGSFAETELAFVVGLAEDIRDKSISPELLAAARKVPVIDGLRVTSHRVVDLGFDAVSVSLKLGSDSLDAFLDVPRKRRSLAA
jgi:hypothetical protein